MYTARCMTACYQEYDVYLSLGWKLFIHVGGMGQKDDIVACQGGGVSSKLPVCRAATRHGPKVPDTIKGNDQVPKTKFY